MAIRYRKGRKSPWQTYWNNPFTGKRECANFATEEEAKKQDSLIKHRLRFERESFCKEIVQEKEEVITLEMCHLLYLKQKQFNKKGIAWQMYCMKLPLIRLGTMPITQITKQHIQTIMDEMLKTAVKPITVRDCFSVLRTVLRWSVAQGYRENIDFPKLPTAHFEKFIPPTQEELAQILQFSASHLVRVIILGTQCGMRIGQSELFQLTWQDVDFNRRILYVHGAKKNPNALWREVPIRDSLLPILQQWHEEDCAKGIEFLIHYKGRPVQSIKTAWRKALLRAGIKRRIRPYDLRHAFATEAIAAGVDIGTVAKLMGHSSATMILNHYQFVMDTQKRQAVEALPDLALCVQARVSKNF